MSLFTAQEEETNQTIQDLKTKIIEKDNEIKEIETRPIEVIETEISQDEINTIKSQAIEEHQKINTQELNKKEDEINKIKLEKIALENKLIETQNNNKPIIPEKEIFSVHFENLKNSLNNSINYIKTIKTDEIKTKFKSAFMIYLNKIKDEVEDIL